MPGVKSTNACKIILCTIEPVEPGLAGTTLSSLCRWHPLSQGFLVFTSVFHSSSQLVTHIFKLFIRLCYFITEYQRIFRAGSAPAVVVLFQIKGYSTARLDGNPDVLACEIPESFPLDCNCALFHFWSCKRKALHWMHNLISYHGHLQLCSSSESNPLTEILLKIKNAQLGILDFSWCSLDRSEIVHGQQ